ncbi:Fur family transcriptional regulator [Brachybacterium sp. J144]|uniref:Fur family transcriptional regulator n=1 Tax=Brachybacterium sp. J144 TaxID=3116487 RepID=UPI002E768AD8|nr:Fur family transcriptional regulator [Brachybacterium sp. J144]MEE1651803.1 Fur family transcriptional regulator [Brachybacterium sp. J144]
MPSIDHTAALRGAGLRVTAPRLATLDAVTEHPHADADTIAQAVRERLGTVSRQAVYDVLNALSDEELLRRVSVGGRSMQYELHRHDNHHHLVCRECGRLEDVPCAVGAAPCLLPHEDHGFAIEVADVVYRGLCSDCLARHRAESVPGTA